MNQKIPYTKVLKIFKYERVYILLRDILDYTYFETKEFLKLKKIYGDSKQILNSILHIS